MNYNQLEDVNIAINKLQYESEVEDDWTPAVTGGDCDSYATAKMQQLVQLGWPETSLRLACCFVEPSAGAKRNRYHLVLLADLNDMTWVLDNRHPYPMEYDLLPYEWHRFWSHDLNAWEWAQGADKTIS